MRIDTSQISLRERKKVATQRALEDAALQLFAEKGFDQVTVEEIAEVAGVSSRTFFRYFSSKEDVVLGPLFDVHRLLQTALANRPGDEPVLDMLRHAVEGLGQRLEELRPQLSRRFAIVRTTPALLARKVKLQEEVRALLIQSAASRLGADPRVDLRPHVAAAWVIAGLIAARELWEHGASGRDLPSLLAEAYQLLSGDLAEILAPPAGQPRAPTDV